MGIRHHANQPSRPCRHAVLRAVRQIPYPPGRTNPDPVAASQRHQGHRPLVSPLWVAKVNPPNSDRLAIPLGNGQALLGGIYLFDCFRGLPDLITNAHSPKERERLLRLQRILKPEAAYVLGWPEHVSAAGHRNAQPRTDRQALPQEWISTTEVAARTGLNPRTIRRHAEEWGGVKVGARWFLDPMIIAAVAAEKKATAA
jgi:hypothetical protein